MRMRKKKNCDARMERCSDIWIKEPEKYKGKWAERFGNDNPIHIEIGCGKGNFIVGMAKMYPDVNFIAIEKVEDVIVMAMEKTVAAELTNVLFMDMDAEKIEVFISIFLTLGRKINRQNADLLISVFLTDIKPCLNRAIIFGLKPIIRLCLIFRLTHLRRKISSLKISALICIIQSLKATL